MKTTLPQQQAPAGWATFPLQQQFGKGGNTPKPPPPPAAPPTATSVEVTQAKRDASRQNQKRAGITSTILAGETGGYSTDQQGNTLLGGG